MALLKNKLTFAAALIVVMTAPVFAQNYNDKSRSDFISLSAGDANRSNIAIQHDDPWPEYLTDTDFSMDGRTATDLMRKFYGRHKDAPPPPQIVIGVPIAPAAPPPAPPQ